MQQQKNNYENLSYQTLIRVSVLLAGLVTLLVAFPIFAHGTPQIIGDRGVPVTEIVYQDDKTVTHPDADIVTKDIKFYVDPAFLEGEGAQTLEEIGQNLVGYVDDMNIIFAKNTNRRFSFDPETGVEVYDELVGPGTCYPFNEDYIYAAEIQKAVDSQTSFGGNGGCNRRDNNELISRRYNWLKFYSRQEIANGLPFNDYHTRQVSTLIHEIGHQLGLGLSEYYSLGTVLDPTGVEPILDIRLSNVDDQYWNRITRVLRDLMLRGPGSEGAAVDYSVFSPLSATLINKAVANDFSRTSCQYPITNFSECTSVLPSDEVINAFNVQILDDVTNNPVASCTVRAFSERDFGDGDGYLIAEATSDSEGKVQFDLGTKISHSSSNQVAYFKTDCAGYEPAGDVVSIFDLQAGKFMPNGGASDDFAYDGMLEIPVTATSTL